MDPSRHLQHYLNLVEQEAARVNAIEALMHLACFPEDEEAAMSSIQLLTADPMEIKASADDFRP